MTWIPRHRQQPRSRADSVDDDVETNDEDQQQQQQQSTTAAADMWGVCPAGLPRGSAEQWAAAVSLRKKALTMLQVCGTAIVHIVCLLCSNAYWC